MGEDADARMQWEVKLVGGRASLHLMSNEILYMMPNWKMQFPSLVHFYPAVDGAVLLFLFCGLGREFIWFLHENRIFPSNFSHQNILQLLATKQ